METQMETAGSERGNDIKEMEEKQQWWWAAEKGRSSRLDYLRKAVWKKGGVGGLYQPGVKVDMTFPQLFTDAWKENEGEQIMLQKARALAHVLDNIPIFITDQAQIVGYVGSAPHEMVSYCQGASIVNEELYNEPGVLPEPEDESMKVLADLNDYWGGRTAIDKLIRILDPEDVVKFTCGTLTVGIPSSAATYGTKDFRFIFKGFEAILDEIDQRMEETEEKLQGNPSPELLPLYEKLPRWEAMQTILEAMIRYAGRYARLARNIAENFESDPKRREELLRIAEVCERVPAHPPRTLQESLQLDHFVHVVIRYETFELAWPHRPDYVHGPYYDRDVNIDKRITKEEALDLLGEHMIRTYETGIFQPRWLRESVQGNVGVWVWTFGGVHEDGSDACNDATIAYMQAARLVRVSNPTFSFRHHPKVKDEVLRECFECIRHGLGYPNMKNDPVLIANTMHWYGHPLEEARQWVNQACMSPCPATKYGSQPFRMAAAGSNSAKFVEYAIHNGYDYVANMQIGPKTGDAAEFKDFEEFFHAWIKQMEYVNNMLTRVVNLGRAKDPEFFSRPVLSSIYERSVEQGLDACDPADGERGNAWITTYSWVDGIDSIAAVKKLIYDEKKYTMAELIKALRANWEGYEQMRLDFVTKAPKWGNDDDYVDDIMLRCLREAARHAWEMKDTSGNPWPILPENASANIFFANVLDALPNGRRCGDACYDGGVSPGPGLDKKGPTAVLKSCSKIDSVGDGRSFLLNQRLSPTQLAGEKGFHLWKSYMKTWAELGIDHVQFNMVDDSTLRAAQRDPEKYQEVIVRVAGYSAHFVDISRKTQDNIIQRTVQGLG